MNPTKIVVIVEDEEALQKIYKTRLAEENYEVHAARTAEEGYDLIRKVKPNLILLDIMLPSGKHGFDLLEDLKRNTDTAHIPVIVLTNLDSERDTALKIGAVEYIVKANTSVEDTVSAIKKYIL